MENPSPEAAAIRELRQWLRQVDACLRVRRELQGAQHESVGLSDVYWHPENRHPALNMVVPRRNTAYVPIGDLQQGLRRLRERGRQPRAQYIEGLFPVHYRDQIQAAGLRTEVRVPLALRPIDPNLMDAESSVDDGYERRVIPGPDQTLAVEVWHQQKKVGLAKLGLGAAAAYINLLDWRDQAGLEGLLRAILAASREAGATLLILPDAPARQSVWGSVLDGLGFVIEGSLITCMDGHDV